MSLKRDDTRGEVTRLEIVDKVDRDRDGYASGFVVEMTIDAHPICLSQPPARAVQLASSIIPIPVGKAMRVLKGGKSIELLVPAYRAGLGTDTGYRDVNPDAPSDSEGTSPADFVPYDRESYTMDSFPSSSRVTNTVRFYVGTAAEENDDPVPVWRTLEMDSFASSHATIDDIFMFPCYRLTFIGKMSIFFEDSNQIRNCLGETSTPRSWASGGKAFQAVIDAIDDQGADPVVFELPTALQVEPEASDRTETMTVSSNADDATVYLNRQRVGETPWVGKVPVDIGTVGPTDIELHSTHDTVNVTISAADTQSVSVARNGYTTYTEDISSPQNVEATQRRLTDPITVTSEESGANVTIDGEFVGTTPWTDQRWIATEYEVVVNAPNKLPHVFRGVQAGQTVHADLVNDSILTAIDNPTFNPGIFLNGTSENESTDDTTDVVNVTDASTVDSDLLIPAGSLASETALIESLDELKDVQLIDANVTVGRNRVRIGQSVLFDAQPSYSLLGNVTGYQWKFGDGSQTAMNPAEQRLHAYSTPGTYTVTLSVTDTDGNTDTATRTITVVDTDPTARFGTVSGNTSTEGSVNFTAAAASDLEGPIASYHWEFGDGTTGAGQQVAHDFVSGGEYDVTLTVTDSGGNTASTTQTVRMVEPNEPPVAAYTLQQDAETTQVTLDASSSHDPDGSIDRYVWLHGDGNASSGVTTTYQYAAAGTYEVRLLVFDDDGAPQAMNRTLSVASDVERTKDMGDQESRTTSPGSSDQEPTDTATGEGSGETDSERVGQEATETTGGNGAGFGPVALLLAVAVLTGIAIRRR